MNEHQLTNGDKIMEIENMEDVKVDYQNMSVNNALVLVNDQNQDLTALPPIRTPKNPGKWRGYDARRVFKKQWIKEYGDWLAADPDDPTHALCKTCGKKIRAHKGDIEKHQKTRRHSKKQTTSDILADLIPMSCGDGLNNGDEYSRHDQDENMDESKEELDHSGTRILTQGGDAVNGEQQIIYFTESAVDPSQQNTNAIIDKLVEKYHQKRFDNLKAEHKATMDLNKEKLDILKQQLEGEATLNDTKNTLAREEHDIRLKFLQREHEAKMKAIEDERDAELRAIEQKLVYDRQEYEKKMRYLDLQLSSIKEPTIIQTEMPRSNGHFAMNTSHAVVNGPKQDEVLFIMQQRK